MSNDRLSLGLLVLRAWFGGVMAFTHGLPKLTQLLGGDFEFADPIGLGPAVSLTLAVFAEFVCGLLVASGLLTRLACVPLLFTMAVAAFIAHGADPFGKKELALAYGMAYVAIALAGPGRFSLDAWRASRSAGN